MLAVGLLQAVGVVAGVVVLTVAAVSASIACAGMSCDVAAVTIAVLPRVGIAVLLLPFLLELVVLMYLARRSGVGYLEYAVVVAVIGWQP